MLQKIKSHEIKVAVIDPGYGPGYVGVPLAMEFGKNSTRSDSTEKSRVWSVWSVRAVAQTLPLKQAAAIGGGEKIALIQNQGIRDAAAPLLPGAAAPSVVSDF